MDIEIIKKIAEELRIDLGMYEPPRLTDTGNGTLRFKSSGKLTHYGEKIISFANAAERHINTVNAKQPNP